jgi:hypothetical protein
LEKRSGSPSWFGVLVIGLLMCLASVTAAVFWFTRSPSGDAVADYREIRQATRNLMRMFKESPSGPPIAVPRGQSATGVSDAAPEPPQKPRSRFEIHLRSGRVILTSDIRYEDEMIFYRTAGGMMGIERSKIREIREP